MLAERRAGDDEEALLAEPRNGEVAFDAAALVEALCLNDCADGHVNLVGADVFEELQRAGPAHFEFVERGFIEKTCVLACHQMFVADGA